MIPKNDRTLTTNILLILKLYGMLWFWHDSEQTIDLKNLIIKSIIYEDMDRDHLSI